MIRLKDLILEFGGRRRINKAQAKSYASEREWKAFERRLRQTYPSARPSYWSDGGKIYAQINLGGGSYGSIGISGSYNVQD